MIATLIKSIRLLSFSVLFMVGASGCFGFIASQPSTSTHSSSNSSSNSGNSSTVQPTALVCTDTLSAQDTEAEFTAFQSLPSTLVWDNTNSWITMNSTTSGILTSPVMVGCSEQSDWSSLSWVSDLPTNKELPGNAQSETTADYAGLANSSLMAGISGIWHLNETSGTYMDSSGNANTGTDHGSTWGSNSNGKFGNAPTFSAGKHISVDDNPAVFLSDTMTISAWIKVSGIIPNFSGILAYGDSFLTPPMGWQVMTHDNRIYVLLSAPGLSGLYTTTPFINDGVWHHIAITFDTMSSPTSLRPYMDGVADSILGGPISRSFGAQVRKLYIGQSIGNGGSGGSNPVFGGGPFYPTTSLPFPGQIDEVAIWNRVLSASEIADLYHRGANRIKFQTRVSNAGCVAGNELTCPAFVGPDGTAATYYTELLNASVFSPTVSIFPAVGKYFQTQVTLESDTASHYPKLKRVTVSP